MPKGRSRRRGPFLPSSALAAAAEEAGSLEVFVAEVTLVLAEPKCELDFVAAVAVAAVVRMVTRSTGLAGRARVKAWGWRLGFGRMSMVAWTTEYPPR